MNEIDFPLSWIFFDAFLALDCIGNFLVDFVVNKTMHTILFGKSIHQVMLMLIYPFNEVGSHANVERTIRLACENIDEPLLH